VKRLTFFLLAAALFAAMTAASAFAQIKYVAVVETEIDEQSGAAAKLNKAEVRLMTAELRSVAVKNLPRDKYNIMTSETIMSQGSAKLEECAEENCVIALGARIGADYIVRGIVSKLGTNLTMSVEMYETEDGNLVATSGVVRSGNTAELLDKAAVACVEMYRTFVATQRSAPKAPVTPPPETPQTAPVITTEIPVALINTIETPETLETQVTSSVTPLSIPTVQYNAQETNAGRTAGYRERGNDEMAQEHKPMMGFLVGCNFSPNSVGHIAFQLGGVHSRPITENILSLNVEGNILMGEAYNHTDPAFGIFGFNVPVTALMQWQSSSLVILSIEAGVDGDLLFGDDQTLLNAGLVIGAGIGSTDEKKSERLFYRYCSGYKFRTHVIGLVVLIKHRRLP